MNNYGGKISDFSIIWRLGVNFGLAYHCKIVNWYGRRVGACSNRPRQRIFRTAGAFINRKAIYRRVAVAGNNAVDRAPALQIVIHIYTSKPKFTLPIKELLPYWQQLLLFPIRELYSSTFVSTFFISSDWSMVRSKSANISFSGTSISNPFVLSQPIFAVFMFILST